MKLIGDFFQAERVGQGGAQQIANADHHFAVAAVQRGDLAGSAVEKSGQRGFVAADGEVEQISVEGGGQLLSIKG